MKLMSFLFAAEVFPYSHRWMIVEVIFRVADQIADNSPLSSDSMQTTLSAAVSSVIPAETFLLIFQQSTFIPP